MHYLFDIHNLYVYIVSIVYTTYSLTMEVLSLSNTKSRLNSSLKLFPFELPQYPTNDLFFRTFERVSHSNPDLLPVLNEFAQFDPETFKHSLSVAHVAENAYCVYAQSHGIEISESSDIFLAGLFHDIGKAGIGKNLKHSNEILYPEKQSGKIITPAEKKLIGVHDELGGLMLKHIFNESKIPKEAAEKAILLANSHHGKLPTSPLSRADKFKLLIFIMSDCAVTMRECRSFSKEARELSINDLSKFLPFELITDANMQVDNNMLNEMMSIVIDFTHSINPILRQEPAPLPEQFRDGKETTILRDATIVAWKELEMRGK